MLGDPGTRVLFGDQAVEGESHSGFKLALGGWLTEDKTLGTEAGFSYLPGQSTGFSAMSNGSTILARPFINANTNQQNSLLVAFPSGSGPTGIKAAGSVAVSAATGSFYGAFLDFRESVIRDPGFRLTTLLGYRFINFSDSLQVQQTTFPSSTARRRSRRPQITAQDHFNAQNMFNGCDIGFEAEVVRSHWSLTWVAKVAAGELQRGVDIYGGTQSSPPANLPTLPGGLLALASNSGNHVSNIFSAVPETGITGTWIINDHLRFHVGYDMLLLMNSARAADQVNININPKLIPPSPLTPAMPPGPVARPLFSLNPSNMWVQMIDAGFEIRY